MPYLAVKKVKGRHYGYVQESYREGGRVRTRTVEYLGAIDPAVAQQVRDTRRQLGQADMAALVKSVREASERARKPAEAQTAPKTGSKPQPTPEDATEPQKRYERMTVNGRPQVVDTKTGELAEPAPDKNVITTGKAATPLRPFRDSLTLPADLDGYGVGVTALKATHAKYGQRLKDQRINPAVMPDIKIAYGHPDGLKRNRDGSYTVTVSRRPQNKRHQINKTQLWKHYRQALASATLDAIADDQPALHHQLQTALDDSHKATTRALQTALAYSASPIQRMGLSLQLTVWQKIPRQLRQKGAAQEVGQASFDTVGDWRGEAAFVLAEARRSKGGWPALEAEAKASQRKHKAAITRRRNQLDDMTKLQSLSARLSGKRRKIIREVMAAEAKLAAAQQLSQRIKILRQHFPG